MTSVFCSKTAVDGWRGLFGAEVIKGIRCTKWLTVLVRRVNSHVCVDHCILLLKHLSNHNMHFITNGYNTFFVDQLALSKATCPFNLHTDYESISIPTSRNVGTFYLS